MAALNYLGVVLVLLVIIGVGVASGRRVKSAADFATGGGRSGPWLICGTIMGALVSSQASIGTANWLSATVSLRGGSPWAPASGASSWPWDMSARCVGAAAPP